MTALRMMFGLLRRAKGGGTAPPAPPPPAKAKLGGQVASLIDFSADAMTCDLMQRARNFAVPIGSPYQYAEATCLLRVQSLVRSANVTTVTLTDAPASYQSDANIRTGMRLVLTCLADPSFDADHATITVTDQTHFTYINPGPNKTYTAVNIYDVAATTIHSVAVGSAGHPIEDFYSVISTVSGSATKNGDLDGTYTGYFDGGIPTGMTVDGASLSNWTPGGSDNQFTLTISGTQSAFIGIKFTGVPTDGSFRLPRIIRNDHDQSGSTYLRPDFKQFLSRYGTMRFMDAGRTNLNAYVKSWAKRPLVSSGLGMPLSDMVRMCNELACDMWYCVPQWASDDYITQAATYIRDNLSGTLKVYFERSNENWNEGTFPHLAWDVTQARKDLSAHFHGFKGENVITSVTKSAGVVTVNLNRPPPFSNGATAVFKITNGSSGYDTPTTGAVMTVSGNSFSFSGNTGTGTASVTEATIIGNPSHPLYSWDKLATPREMAYRVHGKRTYDLAQLVSPVFGGLNGRARVMLMGFNTNFVAFGIQEDKVFPWLVAQYGAMSAWLYAIGGAPYPEASGSDTTPAQIKASILGQLSTFEAYFTRATNLAATYGVHHVQYEGGPDLHNLASSSYVDAWYGSTELRDVQREILNRAFAFGVELHCVYYTSCGFAGTSPGSTWRVGTSMAVDSGAIGAASTPRLQGIDDYYLGLPGP